MGALRKTSPAVVQPTQIIVFPIDQARPDLVEKPSIWERMEESEVGSLVLFELKMFGITAIIAGLVGLSLWGGYTAKSAAGINLDESISMHQISTHLTDSNWKPSHYLN
ncbi:hypothetical protein C0431_00280 [bacterium]|jgi:hypothetical protein|nr:hypothetical protein [bacterium]